MRYQTKQMWAGPDEGGGRDLPAGVVTAEDDGEGLAGEIAAALDGLQRATQLLSRGKVAAAREACNHVGSRLIGR